MRALKNLPLGWMPYEYVNVQASHLARWRMAASLCDRDAHDHLPVNGDGDRFDNAEEIQLAYHYVDPRNL